MLWSSECSQMTKSTLYLSFVCTHCPPGIGVGTTFHGTPGRDFVQSRTPTGVCTFTFLRAPMTAFLSFGLPLAFSSAVATSKRPRLGPACRFHCLPLCAM